MTDPANCELGEKPTPPYFFMPGHPIVGDIDPWSTEGWMSHCLAFEHKLERKWRNWLSPSGFAKGLLLGDPSMARHLVPLLTAIRKQVAAKGGVSVLDIGGGFGDNYKILAGALGGKNKFLKYTVLDNEKSCALGRKFNPDVNFISEIGIDTYDIITIVGTLQYIKDWRGLVDIAKRLANTVYIARSPIRQSDETFHAKQAVCPALGLMSGRKVGVADIVIIAKSRLLEAFEGWALTLDAELHSYREQMMRMPEDKRNVSYFNLMWSRPDNA